MSMNLNTAIHGLGALIETRPLTLEEKGPDLFEIAVGTFAYNRTTGVSSGLMSSYASLSEGGDLPEEASALGITADMIRGQHPDLDVLTKLLQSADLLVARDPHQMRVILQAFKGLPIDHKVWVAAQWDDSQRPCRALEGVVAGIAWLHGRTKDGEPRLGELLRRMD